MKRKRAALALVKRLRQSFAFLSVRILDPDSIDSTFKTNLEFCFFDETKLLFEPVFCILLCFFRTDHVNVFVFLKGFQAENSLVFLLTEREGSSADGKEVEGTIVFDFPFGNNEIAKPIDMMAENAKLSIFCFDKELFDIVDCQLTIGL